MQKDKPDTRSREKLNGAKKQKENEEEQSRLGQYIQDHRDAWKYVHENYHDTWYNCYAVYNNRRVKIGYNSVADAKVTETRTIVEALVANIAGGAPRFEYIPTNEEQEADTKVLSELISYYWDCNHMGVKAQSWVRDSILYGTGILHATWNAEENRPQIDNIPLRDFFVDPTATSLENARFAGFRYLADLEGLKKVEVVDPETGERKPKYKNLDKVEGDALSEPTADEMDKQKKEQLFGSTLGTNNERQVEIILIYYMDTKKVVEIANRVQIIREEDTPFQMPARTRSVEVMVNGVPTMQEKQIDPIKPFLPFAVLRNVIDSSLFYGVGDVETIMERQEILNDIENLDMDNLHFLNNVMWRIDPAYADMAADIESSPGIVIPVPRNALEPLEKPRIDNDLDAKKMEIKEEMRRATAADEVMQGSVVERGRATATEISAVTTQAQTRFKTKLTNMESEGYAQLGSILFKISQIFVDRKMVVRIVGPDGVVFKDYDPFEYSGYYEPHVRLESTVREQKIEQGQKLNQMYQVILNNPVVDQREAVRFIMETLGADDDDIKRMLSVPQAPADPMAAAAAMGGEPNPVLPNGGQMFDPEIAGMMRAREDFAQELPVGEMNGTEQAPAPVE